VSAEGLRAAEEKMRKAGVADAAIATFAHYYGQLESGETGVLPEDDIEPIDELPGLDDLPEDPHAARAALDGAVVIKLNGGLGTSMGMQRAKSLIDVKEGHSFLDVIVRQVLAARERHGVRLPLVLMNSFYTRDDTLAALRAHPDIDADLPLDFLQNREPKLAADDLFPVEWPPDPALEWCPPGHGDLYTALFTSGMLDTLLDAGYAHAFVSNSDNLGAVLEPRILAWMAAEEIPFVSESCPRTEADRKGGHLARLKSDGRLVLRETAQVRPEDEDAMADVGRHRYFNANNLWLDLRALADILTERDGVLGLPLIRNEKTVDPADSSSPEVIQIESAMGAAVGVFPGARAVLVDRARFVPVKTTNDLLVVRSDVYELADDGRVVVSGRRDGGGAPVVDLDPAHFKLVAPFEERFPHGPPSLIACERLTVRGDWGFGRGVVARGVVELAGEGDERREVEDGAVLGSAR
jgi:UTP--glucose-1-phosphate uridylyltransferase